MDPARVFFLVGQGLVAISTTRTNLHLGAGLTLPAGAHFQLDARAILRLSLGESLGYGERGGTHFTASGLAFEPRVEALARFVTSNGLFVGAGLLLGAFFTGVDAEQGYSDDVRRWEESHAHTMFGLVGEAGFLVGPRKSWALSLRPSVFMQQHEHHEIVKSLWFGLDVSVSWGAVSL